MLKNKDTDEVLFVVVFTLLKKEDVENEEAEKANEAVKETGGPKQGETEDFEPRADDLD